MGGWALICTLQSLEWIGWRAALAGRQPRRGRAACAAHRTVAAQSKPKFCLRLASLAYDKTLFCLRVQPCSKGQALYRWLEVKGEEGIISVTNHPA